MGDWLMIDLLLDTIVCSDALDFVRTLPDNSINCVVTSPPYYALRDYGCEGQIGLEETPQQFIARLVELFSEIRRALREDGTCWVNMGSSYASVRVSGLNETFTLRDDLTPQEIAYVFAEIAKFQQQRKPIEPILPVGIDETVTPLASGE